MKKIKLYTYKILIHPLSMLATSILIMIITRSIINPTFIHADEMITSEYYLVPDIASNAKGSYFPGTTKNIILLWLFVITLAAILGVPPNATFDQTLLIQALCAILTEKVLKELKQDTTILYEAEIKKQKLISESPEKYTPKHSTILHNTAKLLHNLTTINKELTALRLMDTEIKAHIKMILRLEEIESVTISTKK